MSAIVYPPSREAPPALPPPSRFRASARRWRLIFFLLAIAFAAAAFLSFKSSTTSDTGDIPTTRHSVFDSIALWLTGFGKKSIAKNERVNILVLGQGGLGHEGPFLTDTIILLSLKPKSGDIVMLSIPRDLAVPIPDVGIRKINEVNSIGEVREGGSGAALAADVIGKTFGVPIAGFVRVDFNGFKELIDILGGITVTVPQTFTDPLFPNDEGGIAPVTFEAGTQQMDGTRALMYVRSRHGTNGEGSDFARARRQQLVLLTLREKFFATSTLLSPGKLANIMQVLDRNVKTNIPVSQFDDLLSIARATKGKTIAQRVLDSSPEGILSDHIGTDGAYLLVPKEGNYAALATYVQGLFDHENLRIEAARVSVLNGTGELGLARTTAQSLETLGTVIAATGNAPSRNWHESVLFDLSGLKPSTAEYLKGTFNARVMEAAPPREIMNLSTGQGFKEVDFILILGRE